MNRVSENIKKIRESSGMTAKTLGKKMGVSEGFILEVEQGKKVISEAMIQRFSKILGKNVSDLGLASFEADVIKEERQVQIKKIVKEVPRAFKEEVKNEAPVNDLWNQAFGDNIKNVPVYSKEMRTPIDNYSYPIVDGKIEKHPFEKVLFIRMDDDSLKGYGIPKESNLMGVPQKEIFEEGYYLIETDEKKVRYAKNLGNGNILLKRFENQEFSETRSARDVKVFIKFFLVKRYI